MLYNQYSEDKRLKNPAERNWTKPMYNYFSVPLSEYRNMSTSNKYRAYFITTGLKLKCVNMNSKTAINHK